MAPGSGGKLCSAALHGYKKRGGEVQTNGIIITIVAARNQVVAPSDNHVAYIPDAAAVSKHTRSSLAGEDTTLAGEDTTLAVASSASPAAEPSFVGPSSAAGHSLEASRHS